MKALSLVAVTLLAASPALATPKSDIVDAVRAAQSDQIKMSNFLQRFGVEVAREQNSSVSGTIQGSLGGSQHGGSLGNVPALVEGIVGIAGLPLQVLNPFAEATSGLAPLGSMLKGLSGMGFMSGSISGELHGEMHGSGYQINNEAHSFLVVAKRVKSFDAAVYAKEHVKELGITDTATIDQLVAIRNNPYIVDDAQIHEFLDVKNDFRNKVQAIDSMIAQNIDSNDSVFDRAKSVNDSLKQWAGTKRVTFQLAGKTDIPLKMYASVCSDETWLKAHYKEYTVAFPGCNFVPAADWQAQIDAKFPFSVGGSNHFLTPFEPVDTYRAYVVKEVKPMIDGVTGNVSETVFDAKNCEITSDVYLFF